MAESQQESNTFSLSSAAENQRHSTDATTMSGSGSALGRGQSGSDHFHPYRRHLGDNAVVTAGCLQPCPSSFSGLREEGCPENGSLSSNDEPATTWDQYNGSVQSSYTDLPAVSPVEPHCFLSQRYPSFNSSSHLQQVSSRLHPNNDAPSSSKYPLQSFSAQSHQESPTQSLYPKPVYSYSILIFMALRNSKTGSLPVSEIYSFMTEHFPYFKTAPDGWKNSVRHNLSLNKCFVKVENKNGNSSRKGCLWALNPARVEKMQEELHKWRRKDPVTVRRSMARPEDLERILGERPERFRSLPSYTNPTLIRGAPSYGINSLTCSPAQLSPPGLPVYCSQYPNLHSHQLCYLPPGGSHLSNSFGMYSPCGQPPATGSLNLLMAPKMPPAYSATPQAEYSGGQRSMQDFLHDGEASYDIDTLDPSLTELQLQGNLWEEFREESLISDSQVTTTTTTPCGTSALPEQHNQTSCLQTPPPPPPPGESAQCHRKTEYEDENKGDGRQSEQYGCLNGLQSGVYSGLDSLTGYLTSPCTTPISLM